MKYRLPFDEPGERTTHSDSDKAIEDTSFIDASFADNLDSATSLISKKYKKSTSDNTEEKHKETYKPTYNSIINGYHEAKIKAMQNDASESVIQRYDEIIKEIENEKRKLYLTSNIDTIYTKCQRGRLLLKEQQIVDITRTSPTDLNFSKLAPIFNNLRIKILDIKPGIEHNSSTFTRRFIFHTECIFYRRVIKGPEQYLQYPIYRFHLTPIEQTMTNGKTHIQYGIKIYPLKYTSI